MAFRIPVASLPASVVFSPPVLDVCHGSFLGQPFAGPVTVQVDVDTCSPADLLELTFDPLLHVAHLVSHVLANPNPVGPSPRCRQV